jgi:hypothetical protein
MSQSYYGPSSHSLVTLPRTETIYAVNASNERVLQELTFRGDTAKHVF